MKKIKVTDVKIDQEQREFEFTCKSPDQDQQWNLVISADYVQEVHLFLLKEAQELLNNSHDFNRDIRAL